ncbi:MAG: hypothetical protein E6Q98_22155 [Rhodospirillaceae bacterium]|nr:MAG: hypothetical protein E6Q98_22155 [Rhodospirillaceae bacterium]
MGASTSDMLDWGVPAQLPVVRIARTKLACRACGKLVHGWNVQHSGRIQIQSGGWRKMMRYYRQLSATPQVTKWQLPAPAARPGSDRRCGRSGG